MKETSKKKRYQTKIGNKEKNCHRKSTRMGNIRLSLGSGQWTIDFHLAGGDEKKKRVNEICRHFVCGVEKRGSKKRWLADGGKSELVMCRLLNKIAINSCEWTFMICVCLFERVVSLTTFNGFVLVRLWRAGWSPGTIVGKCFATIGIDVDEKQTRILIASIDRGGTSRLPIMQPVWARLNHAQEFFTEVVTWKKKDLQKENKFLNKRKIFEPFNLPDENWWKGVSRVFSKEARGLTKVQLVGVTF